MEKIKSLLIEEGANEVGFADLRETELQEKLGYPFGISIAVALNPLSLKGVEKGPTKVYHQEYELFLRSNNGVIISLITIEDEPIKDVFSKEANNGELEESREGLLLTKDMYGGAVNVSDIMMLAYLN